MNDSSGKKTGKLSDKMMQNKSEWGEQETFSGNPTMPCARASLLLMKFSFNLGRKSIRSFFSSAVCLPFRPIRLRQTGTMWKFIFLGCESAEIETSGSARGVALNCLVRKRAIKYRVSRASTSVLADVFYGSRCLTLKSGS